jgi:3-methyl-2-oxobutanoate hydroxymethyltransferase
MKKNVQYLLEKKQNCKKITALTCYGHPTAVLEDQAGIDIILVGDSVGTLVVQKTHSCLNKRMKRL